MGPPKHAARIQAWQRPQLTSTQTAPRRCTQQSLTEALTWRGPRAPAWLRGTAGLLAAHPTWHLHHCGFGDKPPWPMDFRLQQRAAQVHLCTKACNMQIPSPRCLRSNSMALTRRSQTHRGGGVVPKRRRACDPHSSDKKINDQPQTMVDNNFP